MVLLTLGAPQRRFLDRRRRRPRRVERDDPAPVPTTRVAVVRADPLESPEEAGAWLDRLRRDRAALDLEVDDAARELNRLLHAHRAAAADPYARDVLPDRALVVRVGHGTGAEVASGRFTQAYEVSRERRRTRRIERLTPQERLAAIVGGRDRLLVSDELVLRARADLAAGRSREAALQARIALESVLEELGQELGELRGELEADREAVASGAAAALTDRPGEELLARVEQAVGRMERAIRRHRDRPA